MGTAQGGSSTLPFNASTDYNISRTLRNQVTKSTMVLPFLDIIPWLYHVFGRIIPWYFLRYIMEMEKRKGEKHLKIRVCVLSWFSRDLSLNGCSLPQTFIPIHTKDALRPVTMTMEQQIKRNPGHVFRLTSPSVPSSLSCSHFIPCEVAHHTPSLVNSRGYSSVHIIPKKKVCFHNLSPKYINSFRLWNYSTFLFIWRHLFFCLTKQLSHRGHCSWFNEFPVQSKLLYICFVLIYVLK